MAKKKKDRIPPSRKHSGLISQHELSDKGGTIPRGKGHWVRKALLALKKGELLFVHKADWNWRGVTNSPARIVNSLNAKDPGRYTISLTADLSGWVMERVG